MKRSSIIFLLVCIQLLTINTILDITLSAQWQMVGPRKFTTGGALTGSKALAVLNGVPYTVYVDNALNFRLQVKKFDGTNWVDVGAASLPTGPAMEPSLTIDNGILYVAYEDRGFASRASVIQYDGTSWTYVGNRGFSPDEVRFLSIAIHNGEHYVAFEDKANSYEASVMKFDGTSWAYVGSPGFTTGYSVGQAIYNAIAFDGGIPYVIYMSVGNNPSGPPIYETKVMKYDGTAWMPLGMVGYNNAGAAAQSLAFHNGEPYFSILDWDYFRATVKKFDGNNWVDVGTPGFSAGMAPEPQMFIHNGIPYVAYRDFTVTEKLTVMYYDGNNWVPLGGSIGVSPEHITTVRIVVDSNTLYVVFGDTVNYNIGKLSVMSYDLATGLTELQTINNSFEIYPNPTNAVLTVDTKEDVEFIAVLSMNGNLLKTSPLKTIAVDNLPQGVYLIQVKTKQGFGYKRFVKKLGLF